MYTAICFYVRRLGSKGKNNTTLGHFCYAKFVKVGFFSNRVENNRLSLQLYEYDVI